MHLPYVYKWAHIPTLCWYVGSRTAKKCEPTESYICSSPEVKQLIESYPNDWVRTIIATGTKEEMYELECAILQTFDAKNDVRSLNKHNNDNIFCFFGEQHPNKRAEARKKASERILGTKNPMYGRTGDKNPAFGKSPINGFLPGTNNPSSKKVHTPLGVFDTLVSAANAHFVSYVEIRRRAKSNKEKYAEYYFV